MVAPGSMYDAEDEEDGELGPSPEEMFDGKAFVDDAPSGARKFLTALMDTQMWAKFIDERCLPPTLLPLLLFGLLTTACPHRYAVFNLPPHQYPGDKQTVRFFDECISAKKASRTLSLANFGLGSSHDDDTPSFLLDRSMAVNSTFLAPVPNMANLDPAPVTYKGFPALKVELLAGARRVKPLVTAPLAPPALSAKERKAAAKEKAAAAAAAAAKQPPKPAAAPAPSSAGSSKAPPVPTSAVPPRPLRPARGATTPATSTSTATAEARAPEPLPRPSGHVLDKVRELNANAGADKAADFKKAPVPFSKPAPAPAPVHAAPPIPNRPPRSEKQGSITLFQMLKNAPGQISAHMKVGCMASLTRSDSARFTAGQGAHLCCAMLWRVVPCLCVVCSARRMRSLFKSCEI